MNANRPFILVLTSTYPRWAGDTEPPFVYELCNRLSEDFEVIVLAPHFPAALRNELRDGIRIYRYKYCFEHWQKLAYNGGILSNLNNNRFKLLLIPFFLLAQLLAVVRILRKYPISLIHAHWLFPQGWIGLIAAILTRRKEIPVLCTSHGGDLFGLRGHFFTTIKHWVIRKSAALTVVSQAMKTFAMRHLDAKETATHVIPMGVNLLTIFQPDTSISRKSHELLFVGRLVDKKGVTFLIQAMLSVLKQFPDTHLKIVGSGPDQPKYQQLIAELRLERHITLAGAVHNNLLPRFYQEATLFVAPYIQTDQGDQEGLGLVMVEALGCGCPVITSNMPAVRDVIIDNQTGLLTEQRNPGDIAEKIIFLLSNPALREQLANRGRQYIIDKFEWGWIAKRYIALIKNLT